MVCELVDRWRDGHRAKTGENIPASMARFGYVMMEDEEVTVVMVKSGGDGVLTPFPETITRDRRQSWKGEARTPWQRQAADSGGTAGDVAGDVGVVGVSRISGVGDAVLGVGCGVGAMEMEKRETGGPAMNWGGKDFWWLAIPGNRAWVARLHRCTRGLATSASLRWCAAQSLPQKMPPLLELLPTSRDPQPSWCHPRHLPSTRTPRFC